MKLGQPSPKRKTAPQWTKTRRLWIILGLLLVLYTAALLVTGMLARPRVFAKLEGMGIIGASEQPSVSTAVKNLGSSLLHAPQNYWQSLQSPPPEALSLDIKFKDLNKINQKRAGALKIGFLVQGDNDFVPADLRHQGRLYHVKLRLKGDYTDHLQGKKWSYRVHLKGNESIFGMQRFSLEAPWTRGFQSEVLVHGTMRKEGVLAPRMQFIDLTINGRDVGLMVLEEHPSTPMLSAAGRPKSVIVKYDETLYWQAARSKIPAAGVFNNYRTAAIDAFESSRIQDDPALAKAFQRATDLLHGFSENRLSASQVFDTEKLGRFLAVAELWDAWHMLLWNNLRFYYNPQTDRLEPISFDIGASHPNHSIGLLAPNRYPLQRHMFEDPAVRKHYVAALQRLSQSVIQGNYLAEVREAEAPLLNTLHREFPLLRPFDLSSVKHRARQLARLSDANFASFTQYPYPDHPVEYPALIQAWTESNSNESGSVDILNVLDEPVSLTQVQWTPSGGKTQSLPLKTPVELPATAFDAPTRPYTLSLPGKNGVLKLVAVQVSDPSHQQTLELPIGQGAP